MEIKINRIPKNTITNKFKKQLLFKKKLSENHQQ